MFRAREQDVQRPWAAQGTWALGLLGVRTSEPQRGTAGHAVEAETPPCHFAPAVPEISLGITWAGDLAPLGVEAITL